MATKIFISYGREDAEAAKRIFNELKAARLDPWLDAESLIPGQKWEPTIRKAIRESRYFLALLSHRSVNRKGFINKELAEAIKVLEEYPESEIFMIPVRLDDCYPSHERLSELHRVDMFPSWEEGMRQIKKAIKLEANNNPKIAILHIRCKKYISESLQKVISDMVNVEAAYATLGTFDYIAIVSVAAFSELYQVIESIHKLPEVENIQTNIAIEQITGDSS